jgi:pilus assembly protein Flp/PilA
MENPQLPASLLLRVRRRLQRIWQDDEGQGMVEYAFILVLIAMAVLIGLQVLGKATNNLYSNISNGLNA